MTKIKVAKKKIKQRYEKKTRLPRKNLNKGMTKIKVTKKKLSIDITKSRLPKKIEDNYKQIKVVKKN